MERRQYHNLQSLRRIQNFLDANSTRLAEVNASPWRRELDEITNVLERCAREQHAKRIAVTSETRKQQAMRAELLREHMRPIARVATAHAGTHPGLDAVRMPSSRSGLRALLARAEAMTDATVPHAALFVEGGLGADFVAQLLAMTTALRLSLEVRDDSRRLGGGATATARAQSSRAAKVLGVIDVLVTKRISGSASLTAQWHMSKRKSGSGGTASPPKPPAQEVNAA